MYCTTGTITNFKIAPTDPIPAPVTWLRGFTGWAAATWTDQTAHNNATQATGGNQFSQISSVLGGKAIVRAVDGNRGMDLGAVYPTSSPSSKVLLYKCSNQASPGNNILCGSLLAGSIVLGAGGAEITENYFTDNSGDTGVLLTSTVSTGSPQSTFALAIESTSYSQSFLGGSAAYPRSWVINGQMAGITQFGDGTAITQAEVTVGNISGLLAYGFVGDYAEVMIGSKELAVNDINNIAYLANHTYGLSIPYFAKQFIFCGDSITVGAAATTASGSFASLIAASDQNRFYINRGHSGGQCSDLISAFAADIATYVNRGQKTGATLFIGTNDLYEATPPATIYANIVTYCGMLRSAGVFPIVVMSVLPRGSGSIETNRIALNNMLSAGWTGFADGFADTSTLAMGQPGANTNTTWYAGDQIHPNDTGHADLYGLIGPIVQALW